MTTNTNDNRMFPFSPFLESFHFPRLGERFIDHEVRRKRQVEEDIKVGERESEKQNLKSIIIL